MSSFVQVIQLGGRFAVCVVEEGVERVVSNHLEVDKIVAKVAAETFAAQTKSRYEGSIGLSSQHYLMGVVQTRGRWYSVQLLPQDHRILFGTLDKQMSGETKAEAVENGRKLALDSKGLHPIFLKNFLSEEELAQVELLNF